MGSKTIVSQGEDMVVSHLDASYLGLEKPLLTVDGKSGNMNFTDLNGDSILALDVTTGVLSINGQPAIGTTGTDLALSGVLSVAGTSTLHAVSLASGSSIVAAGGASALDMHLASGTTQTGTGAVALNGTVTVASGKSVTSAGGAADLDWSASSGTTKTGTGAVSVNGAVTLAANKGIAALAGTAAIDMHLASGTTQTGTGAIALNGDCTLAANKGLSALAGTGSVDLHLATGTMSTPTGLLTYSGKQAAGATVNLIADPGNAGAIAVTSDGVCAITTAGAETRTLAIPGYIGQNLTLCCDVKVGNAVITVASAYDASAHTTITMSAAGQSITLVGVQKAGVKCWALVGNNGCTLG